MTKVIGVMSTFQPDSSVVSRAKELMKQIDQLIIVDDGSNDSTVLDELNTEDFVVQRLESNLGIATALNHGMELAIELGADYLLTIDQDSILEDSYVEKVISTFRQSASATRMGIVVTDSVNGQPSLPPRYSPEGFGLVEEAIQSGMVITSECLAEVGFLDERLFIDCVDTEFCLRATDAGWNIAVAPLSNISHSLGRLEILKPFGRVRIRDSKPVLYQYHPPFRRYYIVRNNIDLCLRNIRRRPRWVISVLRRELTPQIKTLLSGPQVAKQWLAFFVGGIHGIFRRRGKIPTWLNRVLK